MMTLDDVIEAMERCSIPHYFDCKGCPYEDDDAEVGCRSDDRDADVLHYLKELRDMTDIPMEYFENGGTFENCGTSQKLRNTSQITCPKCHSEFVILPEANNALTWDELRTMEGKPVWVEEENQPSQWYLIGDVETDEDDDPEFVSMIVYDCQWDYLFYKNNMGTTWQAYRKERTE